MDFQKTVRSLTTATALTLAGTSFASACTFAMGFDDPQKADIAALSAATVQATAQSRANDGKTCSSTVKLLANHFGATSHKVIQTGAKNTSQVNFTPYPERPGSPENVPVYPLSRSENTNDPLTVAGYIFANSAADAARDRSNPDSSQTVRDANGNIILRAAMYGDNEASYSDPKKSSPGGALTARQEAEIPRSFSNIHFRY